MPPSSRVLVVDDDLTSRLLVTEILESDGHVVEAVGSGEDAIAAAAATLPDLVLLDVVMEGLDGFATLSRIHGMSVGAPIPVIMITGNDDTVAIDRAYEMGATDFMTKPINWTLLRYRVQYILRADRIARQLGFAREQAEHASRLKSEFLSRLSHEMRTPLNGISGTLSLLDELDLSDEVRELTSIVGQSAITLQKTVENVLDFSLLDSGSMTVHESPFDPRQLVAGLVADWQPAAQAKKVVLTSFVDPEVEDEVIGDATRIAQVVGNLVDNAVKFTPQGSIEIGLRRGASTEQPTLCFEVSDTGIGVSESDQRAIFDPFVQADGSATRQYDGNGLGLTVALHVTQLLGGNLHLRSVVGRGSVFTCELPVRSGRAEVAA